MAFDLFGSLRGIATDSGGLFDTIIDSTNQAGGPDLLTPLDDILSSLKGAGAGRGSSSRGSDGTSADSRRTLPSLPTAKRIDVSPRKTEGVGSVDPRAFDREWMDRLKQFSAIERETAGKL